MIQIFIDGVEASPEQAKKLLSIIREKIPQLLSFEKLNLTTTYKNQEHVRRADYEREKKALDCPYIKDEEPDPFQKSQPIARNHKGKFTGYHGGKF